MKLSFVLSTLFAGAHAMQGPVTESGLKSVAEKRQLHAEFMRAMNDDPKMQAAQLKKRKADKKRDLMEKMYASSRKVQDSSGEYTFENYEWMNPVYQQMIADGVFDMTARAFKYSGCAAIKSFDADRAQQNGNPMVIDTYAVFRLCPEETCNNYSLTGCGKNYGEYVVEMKTYLGYMLEYYEDRYGAYCDYCYACDYDYQVLQKQTKSQCYEDQNLQEYYNKQNQQQQAWADYYAKNGGDMSGYAANQQGQYGQGQYGQGQYGGGNAYGNYGGNRDLADGSSSGGYYSNYINNYANGNSNANGNANGQYGNGYGNGQYGNGQYAGNYQQGQGNWYQNWYGNQQQGGQQQMGYYNEYGEYVDVCAGNGYTDSNGVEYDVDCSQYQSTMMTCSDGTLCDSCEFQIDQNFEKCDSYVCGDYYKYCSDLYEPTACQNGNANGNANCNNDLDLSDFLECTPYENAYGQMYYIGPHCASDHYTISLGVFSDQNCLNFIGETVSIAKVLGMGANDQTLFNLPHDCISCDGATAYADEEEMYKQLYTGQGVYGEYQQAPDSSTDGVVAMCAALFDRSAQCNMHLTNYATMSKYMDSLDVEYEKRYCNFIDNIVYGAYDEAGEILLKPDTFDLSDWRNPEQYKKLKMPAGQAVGLSISVILVISLAALAFFTQRSLRRQSTPWRPKRVSVDAENPTETGIVRQGSGIVLGRSRSGAAGAPLI